MNTKRLLLYLALNALVSASVTLTVLWLWDRSQAARSPVANAPTALAGNPAATPATSPSPAPAAETATPTVYVVRAGDSLSSIAQQFDVAVEELMLANGLTDPNVLSVGQTLVIPVAGVPVNTAPAATVAPTTVIEPPRPTATRDPNVPLPRLAIREVKGAGALAEETLVILNSGGPVDLAGWTLRDASGHLYTFPSLTLFEGGAVSVHTASGADTVTDLYWGQSEAVWTSGKEALLSDPGGNLHARFTIP